MIMNQSGSDTYGLMAEFETPEELLAAARHTYSEGYRSIDAYSPLPIHGLAAAVGFPRTNLPILTFICGAVGAISGYALQYWVHVINSPLNIGGRPLHSGPMFIPVTFEVMILFSAFGAVLGMFHLNRLPRHYHPVFRSERFLRASDDKFFVAIETADPRYDAEETPRMLADLGATHIDHVEP